MSSRENPPDTGITATRSSPGAVTELLIRWQQGDEQAFAELAPLVYAQLRTQARRYLGGERRDHTLQGTALVHEALVRLLNGAPVQWSSHAHFLRLASRLMRRILVDHARGRLAVKRNRGVVALSLDSLREQQDESEPDTHFRELLGSAMAPEHEPASSDVCAIDRALERLSTLDARQAELVELRFFGGMTIDETALAMGISPATVKREWTLARAWLQRELQLDE